MAREEKAKTIEELTEIVQKASAGVVAEYRGLPANEVVNLRRKLRDSKLGYRVVKNTLARIAAEKAGREEITGIFKGPVALIYGYDDVVAPARVLTDYIRSTKSNLAIKGGFLNKGVLNAAQVNELVMLPSREVLLARVMGGIQSPLYALSSVLVAPMRGLVTVLNARIGQLEEK